MTEENQNPEKNALVKLFNPHLAELQSDFLYHFNIESDIKKFPEMFGDIKFVCMGGTSFRMQSLAHYFQTELKIHIPTGMTLHNLTETGGRYTMFKVGPVLTVTHGMGIPSLSIMLHELLKLLYYSKCKGVTLFRIGTSGGIGLEPGSVVISDSVVDDLLQPHMELHVLGKVIKRPALLDTRLANELLECSTPNDGFVTIIGKTMCAADFYEGQGRLNGAFCDYTENDKMKFLHQLYEAGVRNIEMESLCFAAMVHHAGISGAVICTTVVDRLITDYVDSSNRTLETWQSRPQQLVVRLIKKRLKLT